MVHHAPPGYSCPFCSLVQGQDNPQSPLRQTDIVIQTPAVTAFMATRKYPNNPGHVLVIPNQHFENIYDLPMEFAAGIHALSRRIALAMKAQYQCDGILVRQQNEPAGDQHIWHYHMHVIPRYENDRFYSTQKAAFEAEKRAQYVQRLRDWLDASPVETVGSEKP